jgi:hypothetical protein
MHYISLFNDFGNKCNKHIYLKLFYKSRDFDDFMALLVDFMDNCILLKS